jgi:hypothetical protein
LSLNGVDAGGTIDQTAEGTLQLRTRYRPAATPAADGVQITIQGRTPTLSGMPVVVPICVSWALR